MKVLVPSKKLARLKRSSDFAKFLKTEKKEKAAAPPPSEKIILVKRPEEDKERIWHIDKYKQLLKVQVKPDRKVFAEAGRMLYMDKNVKTEVKKARVGENIIRLLFVPYITYFKGEGEVGFAGDIPGELLAFDIEIGDSILGKRTSFIAGIGNIDISLEYQELSITSILGGEGLILEKFTNKGHENSVVFFHACGSCELIELEDEETIMVDVGSVVAWEESVKFEVKMSPIKSGFISGEGIFMVHLSGPGTIAIQTTNVSKLQSVIGQAVCITPPPLTAAFRGVKKGLRRIFRG